MSKLLIAVALSALIVIAGCGKPADQSAKPAAIDTVANMAMPTEGKAGKGTGTVTAIDPATGKITLDHGPIAELQWPAMTMEFGTKPDVLKGIAVGDRVAFEFEWNGRAAELTRIDKQ